MAIAHLPSGSAAWVLNSSAFCDSGSTSTTRVAPSSVATRTSRAFAPTPAAVAAKQISAIATTSSARMRWLPGAAGDRERGERRAEPAAAQGPQADAVGERADRAGGQ